MRMLTHLLGCFPCKNCYCETTQAKLVDNKTVFANTVVMTCSVCGYVNELRTSTSLANNTQRKLYDVNRRVVKAFVSMGKGHRALETFCMVMNMKPMNHRSYFSHIKALHKAFREEVDLSLVSARNEVRKCYGEIDNSGNNVGLIGKTVSYDGTWQKRFSRQSMESVAASTCSPD